MIKKKITYKNSKKNLLVVYPEDVSTFLGKLIIKDFIDIKKWYSKTHNIITCSNRNDVKVDGYVEEKSLNDKFDVIIFVRFNFNGYTDSSMSVSNFKLSLHINKIENAELKLKDYENFKFFQMLDCNTITQLLHNNNDLKVESKKDIFNIVMDNFDETICSDFVNDDVGKYLYYKYGIHNLSDVLYLKTNCYDELKKQLPLKNKKVPIEYKDMIEFYEITSEKVGEYTYIDNVI